MLELLSYPIINEYPKGESKRYDAGTSVQTQQIMFA
jgi:hypothetical protein